MKRFWQTTALATLLGGCMFPASAYGASTKCTLRFALQGWSAFYKTASGTGTITCDNGQKAHIKIRTKGGGLTVGKTRIEGRGSFSDVSSIDELFGSYASADASAGAVNAADAKVVTKGEVSLALSGTGKGWDIGISFGEFVITKTK